MPLCNTNAACDLKAEVNSHLYHGIKSAVVNLNVCNVMTWFLLVINHVASWVQAIDGYVRARPEIGCCRQFLTYGSDPDLRKG